MNRLHAAAFAAVALGVGAVSLSASGQAGIYGVIERVVLAPDSGPTQTIQLFGAFALIERLPSGYASGQATEVAGRVYTNYVYRRPDIGVVKLGPTGGHAAIVAELLRLVGPE